MLELGLEAFGGHTRSHGHLTLQARARAETPPAVRGRRETRIVRAQGKLGVVVRRRVVGPMIVLLISAAGCGGANGGSRAASPASHAPSSLGVTTTEPSCPPATASLDITAKNHGFDKVCLAVQAHEPFTIRFMNADKGVRHNFTIKGQTPAETLLKGKIVIGVKTITQKAPALEAGEYLFHCDVHPFQMRGTLVVSG